MAPGRVRNSQRGAITASRIRAAKPVRAVRAAATVSGSGAKTVTTGPIVSSAATPRRVACQPKVPTSLMTPDVVISSATR